MGSRGRIHAAILETSIARDLMRAPRTDAASAFPPRASSQEAAPSAAARRAAVADAQLLPVPHVPPARHVAAPPHVPPSAWLLGVPLRGELRRCDLRRARAPHVPPSAWLLGAPLRGELRRRDLRPAREFPYGLREPGDLPHAPLLHASAPHVPAPRAPARCARLRPLCLRIRPVWPSLRWAEHRDSLSRGARDWCWQL
jgi:hypothetical protein